MEYTSLSCSHIPFRISLKEGCCYKVMYWTKGFYWLSWGHYFESSTVATMTWLAAMENLCLKWPRICSICRQHFPILSSFMTHHRICNQINTTSTTSGAGTTYLSRAPEWGLCYSIFSFMCMLCRSLFVLFCHCVVRPSIYRFLLPLWYLETLLKIKLSQEPVIAHLVFNLTSKVDRKWGCYTLFWKWTTQISFQLKFLSKRFWCDFYLIVFINRINWLKNLTEKARIYVKLLIAM